MSKPNSEPESAAESARKPLLWLHGEVKTPPFSVEGRLEAGTLLRLLQEGESLGMPQSRPMPTIGPRCAELRVRDEGHNWRIIYRIDSDAILIVDVFAKTTEKTEKQAIARSKSRLSRYDETIRMMTARRDQKDK